MRSVGVRELKERTSQVLRELQASGEEIEVTHHGRVVARLVPGLSCSFSAVYSRASEIGERVRNHSRSFRRRRSIFPVTWRRFIAK